MVNEILVPSKLGYSVNNDITEAYRSYFKIDDINTINSLDDLSEYCDASNRNLYIMGDINADTGVAVENMIRFSVQLYIATFLADFLGVVNLVCHLRDNDFTIEECSLFFFTELLYRSFAEFWIENDVEFSFLIGQVGYSELGMKETIAILCINPYRQQW